jgi:UDP-GlcNAc3NAcA epimerase
MLAALETLLVQEKPQAVLVYGDTNSTLAGALAASKLHIPILHVEAGLRSFNREMPEEVNRVLTDHVSALLFAPTQSAVDNLANEGITNGVHLVGDVMFDAVKQALPRLKPKREGDYAFATLHRPYNVDDPNRLKFILNSLNQSPAPVILPLHPRTRKTMENAGVTAAQFPNIDFVEPVGYLDCLAYQAHSRAVITDSGGIQKEAYALKRRCLTVRYETEWMETLEGGCNTLVGHNPDKIPALIADSKPLVFGAPYGTGDSAARMAQIAAEFL